MVACDFGKNARQLIADIECSLPKGGIQDDGEALSRRIRVGCLRWLSMQKRTTKTANENTKQAISLFKTGETKK